MNRIETARAAAFATRNALEEAREAFEAAEVAHAAAMVEFRAAKAEKPAEPAEPATDTTVYPTKVGRAQTIHAAGWYGGDFNELSGHVACGTASIHAGGARGRETRRESATPVKITCTKCLAVDPARRR